MDLHTGLVSVGVVVFSAVVILLVYMVGIKEKSYEEAIAEQRKLPDDLLLSKKEKNKDKKHKNKAGKKVKEKKEEKEEKEEKPDHIQFEETPLILPPELGSSGQEVNKGPKKKGKVDKIKPILVNKDEPLVIVSEVNSSHSISSEVNHFDLIHPKDDLELIRSHSRENLQQLGQHQSEAAGGNKSPKDTPTKFKKNIKEVTKRKEDNTKEDKKDSNSNTNSATQSPAIHKDSNQKETKDQQQQRETPVKEPKETVREVTGLGQSSTKESKKTKKKHDILAQIGGDKDGVNVSLLTLFIQKAELSRSEIQILIDQLLNKQLDNPLEHSEWTEGRADPVIKLKKQLAEKEKALIDEHEASQAFQAKLKELRAELNNERSRCRQLEEALNAKVTETQTLHTRMQHILESHAAEKQGFARQIEQLQGKVNEDAAIIHKMQEDQGQTQGHLQQELIAQRKQMEVQFTQMRENENALKAQLTQKHVEVQELQNELQATCESSTAEIEMLRQQLAMMQGQLMHSEGQLQHFKEAGDHLQDMTRQLDESRRVHADLDHRLKAAHRHDQELQKQINSLKAELNIAKSEAGESSALKAELMKLKSELSASKNEAGEITSLKNALKNKEDDFQKCQDDLENVYSELNASTGEIKKLESKLEIVEKELETVKIDFKKALDSLAQSQDQIHKHQSESQRLQEELKSNNDNLAELKTLKLELGRLQKGDKPSGDTQLQIARLEEEKDRLSAQLSSVSDMQKEIKELKEEKESLMNQLASLKEGRKNGIDDTVQKSNSISTEQLNLLAQKESLLDALKTELSNKEGELLQLNAKFTALQSDVNQQHNLAKRLQDDLDVQKSKNNDLTEKLRLEQEESTKAFLQRIFPDIKVSAKSYEQWISAFEAKACTALTELKNQSRNTEDEDLEKQNEQLQVMITHYKNIVHDTQSMLKKLESNVELEETRWQAQLHQKENEVASLRIELDDLRKKLTTREKNETRVGSCSVSEQTILNGPPSSESPKSEGGSGKK